MRIQTSPRGEIGQHRVERDRQAAMRGARLIQRIDGAAHLAIAAHGQVAHLAERIGK